MRADVDNSQIAPKQYSRQQRSAVYHGINCKLLFDYQHYLQWPFSLAWSDIKSCYDEILHYTIILDLQLLGIPLLAIISMLDTI